MLEQRCKNWDPAHKQFTSRVSHHFVLWFFFVAIFPPCVHIVLKLKMNELNWIVAYRGIIKISAKYTPSLRFQSGTVTTVKFDVDWLAKYFFVFQENLGQLLSDDEMFELMEIFERCDVDSGKETWLQGPVA